MLRSEQKIKEDLSIVFLQRLWKKKFRLLTTYRIVEYLFSIKLTIEHVKSIRFDSLVVFLKEKSIISACKACLQRIYKLCILRHGSLNTSLTPENININVFLGGFMIAYKSTCVFENIDTLENALLEATIPLITTFQNICKTICSSAKHNFQDVPYVITKDFSMMLFKYFKCFKAWKKQDNDKLIYRLKHTLTALYQTEENLPHNESENPKIKIEFHSQIKQLRHKLQLIAGIKTLREFDEQRILKISKDNIDIKNESHNLISDRSHSLYTERVTNEHLAHELLLNPEFQLNECDHVVNPIFNCIKKIFNQSFWNSLEDDLKFTTPSYSQVLHILKEIHNGIDDLTINNKTINISKIIDLDFIREQFEARMYTWDNCMQLISSIVKVIERVQVTRCDKEINETKENWKLINQQMLDASVYVNEQPQALHKALKFLINCVNVIRIDSVNTRLRFIAPIIKDYGIDYERGNFKNKLDKGIITIEHTYNWICSHLIHEVASNKVYLEDLLEGKLYAFLHIHSIAMLSLITNQTTELCPETLSFDVQRLLMLQQEFQYIVTTVTIMVKVNYSIRSTNNIADLQVLTKITEFFTPDTKLEIDLEQTILEIGQAIQQTSLTQDNQKTLLRNLKESTSSSDAIRQIIDQKIKDVYRQFMKDRTFPHDLNFINTVSAFVPSIEKSVIKLLTLINYNWSVHFSTYYKLIEEVVLKLKVEC